MRYLLAALLASCLLAGCSADSPPVETIPQPENAMTAAAPVGLWDMGNALEVETGGALRVYPLDGADTYTMRVMGENLLLLSGDDGTTLTKLSGDELYPAARIELDFFLAPEDPSLQVSTGGLSYYDPLRQQTVILDASLKEIRHINAPEGLTGQPMLSADQDTLYYCTESSIRAWDLTAGIHRIIKETADSSQALIGLYENQALILGRADSLVQVLAIRDGALLWEGDSLTLSGCDGRYYAIFPNGCTQALLYGQAGEAPTALTPADLSAEGFFLPQQNAALTISALSPQQFRLDHYDLASGLRDNTLTLDAASAPLSLDSTAMGWVYLLLDTKDSGQAIYRWDPTAQSLPDRTTYTGPYYTAQLPDYHGLVGCQAAADRIGEKFGIQILVWDDTLSTPPWDYNFQTEYLVPVLERELELLEQRLSQFPKDFLSTAIGNFSGLKICLVRSISGTPESGSLDHADGIQYFVGTDAYIALAVGDTGEKALYHELYHVMETQILNKSIALDQWDKLNPKDFSYDYDYAANARRDPGDYLAPDIRSFVDLYSMSFPKEDRARIFEYAMTDGNEALFAASPLQYKLKALCQGIREAFGLEKSPETYPWEQYLNQSLAYTK